MTRAVFVHLSLALLCTALGGATGWYLACAHHGHREPLPPGDAARGQNERRRGRGDHAHAAISEATLHDLGVTFGKAERRAFVVTVAVAATVEDTPTTVLPLTAPVGGQVREVMVRAGAVAAAGDPVVRLVRDPLPRPELSITGPLLSPASESLHDAVHSLRQAHTEVEVVAEELARVEKFTEGAQAGELPVLPRQRAIDLRQQLVRARAAYAHRVAELDKHGLTDTQIEAIARGAPLPTVDAATWRQALLHNGLWGPTAQAVHDALPADVRAVPWVVATVGELAANGLLSPQLAAWLRGHDDRGRAVQTVGALLQRGHTLADIERLHALGALAPEVSVVAPSLAADYDVAQVVVAPGARVEAGQTIAVLRDPRTVQLRVAPLGAEVAALTAAFAEGAPCRATPLIPGAGPDLADVRFDRVLADEAGRETIAYAFVHNEVLASRGGDTPRARSWQLRPGTRYLLRIPARTLPAAFVLPAGALVRDGSKQVVLIRDEHGIEPVEVAVLHHDDEFVVVDVPAGAELKVGSEVVYGGGFALLLALKNEGAGAHHPHDH